MAAPVEAGAVEVRGYRAGDEQGILDLFRRVFAAERSLDHWRWKFRDNPAGQHIVLAVGDGRIVGQFAGLPSRGTAEGRPCLFSQLLDHMVDPSIRRRGAYAAMARAFHERFVAPDPGAVFFGFNLDDIHQIEKRLYGMELLYGVGALGFDLSGEEPWRVGRGAAIRAARYAVGRVPRFGAVATSLWRRAAPRYGAAIARDERYLDWRYADCPDVDYTLLVARYRLTLRPAGLAVLRLGWPHEPIAALVDWVVPGGRRSVWMALLDECHAVARRAGLPAIKTWLAPGSPDRPVLLELGYRPEPSPFLVSAWNDGRPERAIPLLRERWHWTMGDTDIF